MSVANGAVSDVERQRQQEIADRIAEDGESWADDYLPGTSGCHELLDRASLLMDMLDRYLVSHPACQANAEWYRLAESAARNVRELYQRVGAGHLASE